MILGIIYIYIQEGTHLKNRSVAMRGTRDHSLLRILTEEFNYCFQRSRPLYFFSFNNVHIEELTPTSCGRS